MRCSLVLGVTFALAVVAASALSRPSASAAQPARDVRQAPDALPVDQVDRMRIFVSAEYAGPGGATGEVWVLEGKDRFELVNRIPVGRWPHQLSVSPNGRWVAVANRSGNDVSVIDPGSMTEVARVRTGRVPHGITWHSDSSVIYIAHEAETYIGRIRAETWEWLPPLNVGARQHVTASFPTRPNELWFTVAYTAVPDQVRMINVETGAISRMPGGYVHDVMFTPDGSEVWVVHGGFLNVPTSQLSIYDPITRRRLAVTSLPGRYPFHTQKANRDGVYYLPDTSLMLLSDHIAPGLMWIDWRNRRIVGTTPTGPWVFHTTYNPVGHQLLTTSNMDGMVNVIDAASGEVVQKVPVPRPHGIVGVGLPRGG